MPAPGWPDSWINLGEVFYVVKRDQGEDEALETLRDLRPRLDLDLPSEKRIIETARIKADHPLSYADAVAAATAIAHDATLLTGNLNFSPAARRGNGKTYGPEPAIPGPARSDNPPLDDCSAPSSVERPSEQSAQRSSVPAHQIERAREVLVALSERSELAASRPPGMGRT